MPLYCRIKRSEVLDNFTRGRIFEYIRSNPGVTYNRIMFDLEVVNGTLVHHLSMLERHDLIFAMREGLHKRFYPRHVKVPKQPYLSELQEMIIEEVERNPGATQVDVAETLGKSEQVVHYHIRQLSKAGFIRRVKKGRSYKCYPKERGRT